MSRPQKCLKKAVEGIIPDELIYRKKMGFDAPMAEWLRHSFGRRVEKQIISSDLIRRGDFDPFYITNLFSDLRSDHESQPANLDRPQSGGVVRLPDRSSARSG